MFTGWPGLMSAVSPDFLGSPYCAGRTGPVGWVGAGGAGTASAPGAPPPRPATPVLLGLAPRPRAADGLFAPAAGAPTTATRAGPGGAAGIVNVPSVPRAAVCTVPSLATRVMPPPDTGAPLYVTLPVTSVADPHPAAAARAAAATSARSRMQRRIVGVSSVGGPPVADRRPGELSGAHHFAAVDAGHVHERRGGRVVGDEPDRPVAQEPVAAARVQAPVVAGGRRV